MNVRPRMKFSDFTLMRERIRSRVAARPHSPASSSVFLHGNGSGVELVGCFDDVEEVPAAEQGVLVVHVSDVAGTDLPRVRLATKGAGGIGMNALVRATYSA